MKIKAQNREEEIQGKDEEIQRKDEEIQSIVQRKDEEIQRRDTIIKDLSGKVESHESKETSPHNTMWCQKSPDAKSAPVPGVSRHDKKASKQSCGHTYQVSGIRGDDADSNMQEILI